MNRSSQSRTRSGRAVLLDRDGTIIVDKGYLSDPAQIEFERGAIDGLRHLAALGFDLMVVTNQSGIGRGYFSREQAEQINEQLDLLLRAHDVQIAGWYLCPHVAQDACDCRKPMSGMALAAARDHELDLTRCYVIGDKLSDLELGQRVGATSLLVETGCGADHAVAAATQGFGIVADLAAAATAIARHLADSVAPSGSALATLHADYAQARDWLLNHAFPLWSTTGTDRRDGGFFEAISMAGVASEMPRRTRVVARQIYAFSAAARLGWAGPAEDLAAHGLTALYEHCLLPDGLVATTYDARTGIQNTAFDLYDHAFALFALAEAARTERHRTKALEVATRMIGVMTATVKHPIAGFWEHPDGRLPLRANPHMHLLEACLAFERVRDPGPVWRTTADAIVELALTRFIDPETGALAEFFDAGWQRAAGDPGRLVEPGHQFEWGWLLHCWNRSAGNDRVERAARRLIEIGEQHGLAENDAGVIDALWADLSLQSGTLRCWPQTERLKAWVTMATQATTVQQRDDACRRESHALRSLTRFLDAPVAGAWHDRLDASARPIVAPAPASTLYHIVCALETCQIALRQLGSPDIARPPR